MKKKEDEIIKEIKSNTKKLFIVGMIVFIVFVVELITLFYIMCT